MLHTLLKSKEKKNKRIGQGWGSGKGKYSTKGQKGQKAREDIKPLFEGGQNVIYKHLPMLRGKFKNKPMHPDELVLNIQDLERNSNVKNGTVIDKAFLIKIGLVTNSKALKRTIKLLSKGVLTKKLIVKIPASKSAIEKIKKLGGEY